MSASAILDSRLLPRKSSTARRRRFPIWAIIAVVVLGLGGFAAFCYFAFAYEIEEPVTEKDRQVVVTAERVALITGVTLTDATAGRYRKIRHLDGSRELTYEYDSDDDFSVNCEITVERSAKDATMSYAGQRWGTKIDYQLGGAVQQTERNYLWRWGDDSTCALLKVDDQEVGNLFMARKGRRFFTLTIIGVSFDEPAAIRDLLAPMLQRLENYDG